MLVIVLAVFVVWGYSQSERTGAPVYQASGQQSDALGRISSDVSRLTDAVEAMNRSWKRFFDTFSSNQSGALLDERQRALILALEVLNRLEQSLVKMQKLKLELSERQSTVRLKLAGVTDDLRPESIDRLTAWRGTTDAETVRDFRRQALIKEQRDLSTMLSQITRELDQTR